MRPTAHLLLLAGLFGCTGKLDVSLPGPVTEGRIDPVTVSSSLTKVKGLLTGYPPTDAEIQAVQADPKALRHAFSEIMLNALQANPDNPTVAVNLEETKGDPHLPEVSAERR